MNIGTRVTHLTYGDGTVTSVTYDGIKITVRFDRTDLYHGDRALTLQSYEVTEIAKLSPAAVMINDGLGRNDLNAMEWAITTLTHPVHTQRKHDLITLIGR